VSVLLDVYGLRVSVEGWPEVVDAVRLDYAWFEREEDGRADVEIVVERRPPDFGRFGDLTASFVTPRNVVYRSRDETVVDHLGNAVSVVDRKGNRMRIEGEDEQTVHDAVYYFVLGRVGEHLDARGLVRLHSLGVAGAQGAVALLLPPGGGKSTLALQALGDERARLLSEDSPVLDSDASLHPFPLRIAVREADAQPVGRRVEPRWVYPKVAVEVETFADRIATEPVPLRHLVIGRRSLAREPRLERLPRSRAIVPLLREGVAGVGLYQGLGYAHQRGAHELARKLVTAARRARVCATALARAQVWELILSRDAERNWDALAPLVR
jgi:hypothetical protein